MKKQFLAGLTLSVVLSLQSVSQTLAIGPAALSSPAAQRQENRQVRRDQVLERIAGRVEERFTRHAQRLQAWIDRASQHLDKLSAKGKDVTQARQALETARTSLANAIALGEAAVAQLRAVEPAVWSEQKPAALAAREAVKKAQVAFAQVIKDMKLTLQAMRKANQ